MLRWLLYYILGESFSSFCVFFFLLHPVLVSDDVDVKSFAFRLMEVINYHGNLVVRSKTGN